MSRTSGFKYAIAGIVVVLTLGLLVGAALTMQQRDVKTRDEPLAVGDSYTVTTSTFAMPPFVDTDNHDITYVGPTEDGETLRFRDETGDELHVDAVTGATFDAYRIELYVAEYDADTQHVCVARTKTK